MKRYLLLTLLLCNFAWAKNEPALVFEDARIFMPLEGSRATGGYAIVKNASADDINLIVSDAIPFKVVETHETVERDGRKSMQKLEKFFIKAGKTLELKPGGNHIMFFDSPRKINEGEVLIVKFLANGKPINASFKVVPRVPKTEPAKSH